MADGNTALPIRRRPSYRALERSMFPRPRTGASIAFSCEPRHFLDACSLCRAPLLAPRDIYMYKGDTPFCSEECRQQQIELDEAMEREASSRRRRWLTHQPPPSYVSRAATPVGGLDAVIAS